jgi:SWI/SNF-related matrix-associated actin-dependent regulator 1 of chromatin subfamily A
MNSVLGKHARDGRLAEQDLDLDFLIAESFECTASAPPDAAAAPAPLPLSLPQQSQQSAEGAAVPPLNRTEFLLAAAAARVPKTLHLVTTMRCDGRLEIKVRVEPADHDLQRTVHSFLQSLDYLQSTGSRTTHSYTMDAARFMAVGPSTLAFELQRRFAGAQIQTQGLAPETLQRLQALVAPNAASAAASRMAAAAAEMKAHLPPALLAALKPYQEHGIAFAIANGCKMLFADDMGLGKTLQAIAVCEYVLSARPRPAAATGKRRVLVLCPSSLRVQWAREFAHWVPARFAAPPKQPSKKPYSEGEISVIFKSSDVQAAVVLSCTVVIATYDLAAKFPLALLASFDVFVADESHSIKNYAAKRTQALLPIMQRAPYVLVLSGTPMLGRPVDMYTQIRAARPELFRDFHSFGARFCGARLVAIRGWTKQRRGGGGGVGRSSGDLKKVWDYSGSSHEAELYFILSTDVMLRRLKRDVLKELPAVQREIIYISPGRTLPPKLRREDDPDKERWLASQKKLQKVYQEQWERIQTLAAVHGMGTNAAAAAEDSLGSCPEDSILNWYNELVPLKLPAVLNYLEENLFFYGAPPDDASAPPTTAVTATATATATEEEEEEAVVTKEQRFMPKTIILAHHGSMLNGLEAFFREKFPGTKIPRIDGSTSGEARALAVDQFQGDPACRVILLSITAAGVGLTLTAASLVLFAELHWTAAYLTQAEARCHRIGQRGTVTARYLLLEDSFELDLWHLVERKLDTTSSVLDNEQERRGMQARVVEATSSSSF